MKKYWIILASILAALLIAAGAFLLGKRYGSPGLTEAHAEAELQGQRLVDLGPAIAIATRHVPGEVLKVELEREDGRFVYEVKVLAQDGYVREVELDARDGSLIEIEDD